MPDDAPSDKPAETFDVVKVLGKTEDGGGTQVLRARPGKLETGEMRPLVDGKPVLAGEVVSLEQRTDVPTLFNVKVQHEVKAPAQKTDHHGPAQVATDEYRQSWERTFGPGKRVLN